MQKKNVFFFSTNYYSMRFVVKILDNLNKCLKVYSTNQNNIIFMIYYIVFDEYYQYYLY